MSIRERVIKKVYAMSEEELLQLERDLKKVQNDSEDTPSQTLVEFLQASPWVDVELDLERSTETVRSVEF